MVGVRARPFYEVCRVTTGIARIAPNGLTTAAATTGAPFPVATTFGMMPLQLEQAISLPLAIAHGKATTPLPSATAPGKAATPLPSAIAPGIAATPFPSSAAPGKAAIPLPLTTAPGRAAILGVGGAAIAHARLTACNKSI